MCKSNHMTDKIYISQNTRAMLQMQLLNTELSLFPDSLDENHSLVPVYIQCILTPTCHDVETIVIKVQSEILTITSMDKCGN